MAQTQTRNLFQDTLRDLERDFKRLQKKADARRREIERRAEKELRRLRKELRSQPLVKRVESAGSDARRRLEEQVEGLLGGVGVASRSDVARLERKVNALNRKLKALEKQQGQETSRAA